jgi:hypothetical protein
MRATKSPLKEARSGPGCRPKVDYYAGLDGHGLEPGEQAGSRRRVNEVNGVKSMRGTIEASPNIIDIQCRIVVSGVHYLIA